ncbi:nitrous oxide reductase family maturation protein NosD [Mesobacillus maritimus]|uniref:nitrous oxide reductase family maturation protein NosD n=1 Tax=Mesobacillus maritimus TaxID=1643336 RepID=UPI00203D1634|nr:nitrous oxide reductase family maturation protein NosD [Mesobacillus maritimus]MCM3668844.1 nitrous oxide reductase family maturation protein NosD [Mesobacillus maritimus]
MKKILSLLVLFALILGPCRPGAATVNLQTLIDKSEPGAKIELENTTYEGNITIDKPLHLIGQEKTVIKGDATGNVVSIRAEGVTVENMAIENSSMDRNSSEEYAAVKVYTNGNTLRDLAIKDSFHGVYLSKAHENTIDHVKVIGSGKGEIAAQGNGLHIYYSNQNVLTNNEIEGTRDGMFFDYADGNISTNNKISYTRYGLHYMYSNRNEFKNNIFTFNTGGAAIMHSNELKLENNQFVFNYGHRSFGLLLLSANDNQIENNTFYMNQRGLYIDQATRNLIRGNQIYQNQIGIELWASSNEQVFTENTIHDNTLPAVTLGGQGHNSWSKDGIGNNWGSSFPLLDLDQNGIGDHSAVYQSSLYELIEEQELTYLFLKSPAITVYEKMHQLLNNSKTMFEDDHPLVQSTNHHTYLWAALSLALGLLVFYKIWSLRSERIQQNKGK